MIWEHQRWASNFLFFWFHKHQAILSSSSSFIHQDEMERGDIPKSIQCYMHETCASEEDAREHMKYLIGEAWKKMNKARVEDGSLLSRAFIGVAENLARMAQCMYQYEDGHGAQGGETVDRVLSLLINPIPLT